MSLSWALKEIGSTYVNCSTLHDTHRVRRHDIKWQKWLTSLTHKTILNITPNQICCIEVVLLYWTFNQHGFRLFRKPWKVCSRCSATKGTTDASWAYTNADAPWLQDEFATAPWNEEPEFTLLSGFRMEMIPIDALHCFHLGIGRDLVGSVIRAMAKSKYWPGSNLDKQLAHASADLKTFARSSGLKCQLKKLTKANLNWVSDGYPECHCKGNDTFVLIRYLNETLHNGAGQVEIDADITTLVWAADSMLSVWTNSDMFLTEQQLLHIQVVGQLFVRTYLKLAVDALQRRVRLWRARPKFHLFHHLVLENRKSRFNPHYWSTWMDEDAIKRAMRVKRRTHKLQASDRCLKRWLLGLRPKLESVMEKNKCV